MGLGQGPRNLPSLTGSPTAMTPCTPRGRVGSRWGEAQQHLSQLEQHPRVVAARDLVQEVIHQLLAVAPSILHELLQAEAVVPTSMDAL